MNFRITVLILMASVAAAYSDQMVANAQQALKDQGFYYGEVTGEKNTDTTAAIRRYQIRNGLQITGELNDETLKSLGVNGSAPQPMAKPAPSVAPETSDLRDERRETAAPTNPLTGQPFPESPSPRRQPTVPEYDTAPGPAPQSEGYFAGTPYQAASAEVQRNVIVSAENILASRGLYRGAIDGLPGPDLEFSLRAYQARVRLPVSGRLDLKTLAALELLPGANRPIHLPRRRPLREAPVRGEWIPEPQF
jgi:peptidoglycan hydrolase-like protein with peptidoglycan-binding domain